MTGGGKQRASASDNSRNYTLTKACRFIKKQSALAASYFRKLIKKLNLHAAYTGSILIEFAVCMPVLIILLYYINDLSKLKRYYDQTEFVAQQMVNIIQNISQNRENKRITKQDLIDVHVLAWQTMFPGTSMFQINSKYPKGIRPGTAIVCVKGLENGNASCCWKIWLCRYKNPGEGYYSSSSGDYYRVGPIKYATETLPSNIYSSLKINPGEVKIILAAIIERINGSAEFGESDRSVFGLLLSNPPMENYSKYHYFFPNAIVIFKPQEGLFDDTPPK